MVFVSGPFHVGERLTNTLAAGPEWGLSEKISSRYRVVATSADEGDVKGAAGRSNMAFFMPEATHHDKQLEHRDAVRTGV